MEKLKFQQIEHWPRNHTMVINPPIGCSEHPEAYIMEIGILAPGFGYGCSKCGKWLWSNPISLYKRIEK